MQVTEHAVPPAAPPIEPGHGPTTPQRVIWPTVLGIVEIIFGVGGVLMYGSWLVLNLFLPDTWASFYSEGSAAVEEVVVRHAPLEAILAAVQGALAAMLLAVGVGTYRRRPWAVGWSKAWAVARIAVALAVGVMTAAMQQEQMAAMASGGGVAMWLITAYVVLVAAFVVVWGAALPAFVLIWLRLRSVRAETAAWGGRGGAA